MPDSDAALSLTCLCWREFAQTIPERGRVLDLGTGRGYVLEEIGGERPDLSLVGVDAVASLPRANPRLLIHSGVGMEHLPFEADAFDAICSRLRI